MLMMLGGGFVVTMFLNRNLNDTVSIPWWLPFAGLLPMAAGGTWLWLRRRARQKPFGARNMRLTAAVLVGAGVVLGAAMVLGLRGLAPMPQEVAIAAGIGAGLALLAGSLLFVLAPKGDPAVAPGVPRAPAGLGLGGFMAKLRPMTPRKWVGVALIATAALGMLFGYVLLITSIGDGGDRLAAYPFVFFATLPLYYGGLMLLMRPTGLARQGVAAMLGGVVLVAAAAWMDGGPPSFGRGPWGWLAIVGFGLMVVGAYMTGMGGSRMRAPGPSASLRANPERSTTQTASGRNSPPTPVPRRPAWRSWQLWLFAAIAIAAADLFPFMGKSRGSVQINDPALFWAVLALASCLAVVAFGLFMADWRRQRRRGDWDKPVPGFLDAVPGRALFAGAVLIVAGGLALNLYQKGAFDEPEPGYNSTGTYVWVPLANETQAVTLRGAGPLYLVEQDLTEATGPGVQGPGLTSRLSIALEGASGSTQVAGVEVQAGGDWRRLQPTGGGDGTWEVEDPALGGGAVRVRLQQLPEERDRKVTVHITFEVQGIVECGTYTYSDGSTKDECKPLRYPA